MGSGLCSRDLDVLRAQRIIVFLITHKSTGSEIPITRKSSFTELRKEVLVCVIQEP